MNQADEPANAAKETEAAAGGAGARLRELGQCVRERLADTAVGEYLVNVRNLLFHPQPPVIPKLAPIKSRSDFGVECYKQIRAEVATLLARIENLFKSSLLVSSGVFAWLLTQAFGTHKVAGVQAVVTCFKLPHDALLIVWWIPTAFIVLSGLITLATHIRIAEMSGFLHMCECALGHEKLSWEVYFRPKPPLFFTTVLIAWVLLLLASISVAMIGTGIGGGLCPTQ